MYYTLPVAKRTRAKEAERIRKIHKSIRKKRSVQNGSTSTKSVSHVVLDDSDEDVVFIDDKDVVGKAKGTQCIFIDDDDDSDSDDAGMDGSEVGENMGLNFGRVKVENRREESEGRKVEESSNWCDLDRETSGLGARVEDERAESHDVLTISEDDEETERAESDDVFTISDDEETESSSDEEEEPSETEHDDEDDEDDEDDADDDDFLLIETSSSDEESRSEKESAEEEGDEDEREVMIGKLKKKSEIENEEKRRGKKKIQEEWSSEEEDSEEGDNGIEKVVLLKKKKSSTVENAGKRSNEKRVEEEGHDGIEEVVLLEEKKKNSTIGNAGKRNSKKKIEEEGDDGIEKVVLLEKKKRNSTENAGKRSIKKKIEEEGSGEKEGGDDGNERVVSLEERKRKNTVENNGKRSSKKKIEKKWRGEKEDGVEGEDMVVLLEKRKMNSTRENEGKKISKKKTEEERSGEKEEGDDGNEKVVLLEKRKRKNKKEKEGGNGSTKFETANRPVFLEVEPDASGGDGAGVDDDEEEEEQKEDEGKEKEGVEEKKEQEHLCGGEKKKRKQIRAFKEEEVRKILADSISHNTELNFEEEIGPVIQETTLPQKFTFGVEKKIPPNKTEEDREMDEMWADLASVLYSNDVTNTAAVRNDVVIIPEVELEKPIDTTSRCKRGIHNLILDEEKGLVCKHCYHVEVEIRHYVEPFAKNPYCRSSKRESNKEGQSIFSKLHHQDSTDHSQLGCDLGTHAQRTVWDIIPGIGEGMHDHQTEGFEFLWKNIGGGIDLDELKDTRGCNGGNGCIISHAPGTGKTRLAIAFIQSYMKLHPACKPVIIAPCSMLNSWEDEFRKWNYVKYPFHNLNKLELSGEEDKDAITLLKSGRCSTYSPNSIRMVKIYSWIKSRSILAISYQLFKEFAGEANLKKKVRFSTEHEQVRKVLLELPGLLVLDEGHTPRNEGSQLFKVFENVKTGKRIILSGTPFQNNFDELFNTLSLANPKFFDRIASIQLRTLPKRRRKGTEARQWWNSLTSKIDKADNDRVKAQNLEEVRKVIGEFVHVHRGDILQSKLPGLRDSVLILQPPLHQKAVIDAIQLKKQNNFNFEYWTTVVSVHPSLLPKAFPDGGSGIIDWSLLEDIKLNPDAGCKTKFVMELIRLSILRKEKVLVFGQFISSLDLIGEQLKHYMNWIPEKDFLYMDGRLDPDRRKALIDNFNIDNEAMVMLASTKACSEGINLVGASRVVLLDVVWNPSVERQAISRAYRLGQKKIVHVYHLISSGSMEEMKYWRQAEKEKLSEMVFYSADDSRSNAQVVSDIGNNDKILEDMVIRFESMFKKIIYQPKESNLVQSFRLMDL